MVKSAAKTVAQYLKELPADRRAVVSPLRDLVRKHIPKGYEENMNWGVICYEIPLERYPDTHNGQPLGIVAIGAQKHYCALYVMWAYMNPAAMTELKAAFKASGKKLDMGKVCLRFNTLDDLPLATIGKMVGNVSVADYIAIYEAGRGKAASKARPKPKSATKTRRPPPRSAVTRSRRP